MSVLILLPEERRIELCKDVISIGRASENDIQIVEKNVSREHCRIYRTSEGYKLLDLKSRNGTFVNGVLRDEHLLRRGDKIELGTAVLYFEEVCLTPTEELISTDLFFSHSSSVLEGGGGEVVDLSSERLVELCRWPSTALEQASFLRSGNGVASQGAFRRKMAKLILDQARSMFGLDYGLLVGKKGGAGLSYEVLAAYKLGKRPTASQIAASVLPEVVERSAFLLTNRAHEDGRFLPLFPASLLRDQSVVCMPFSSAYIQGALCFMRSVGKEVFSRRDIQLLSLFCDQALLLWEVAERRWKDFLASSAKVAFEKAEGGAKGSARGLGRGRRPEGRGVRPRFRYDYSEIITAHPKMFEIFKILDRVVNSSVPVLIQGESGTGKELIARALHFNSKRREAAFVSENCAAIPKTLMESEFFGYEKGAFTGADRRKLGLFEVASGGTLFLDEIAEMPLEMQTKFLRVLQEGEIRRVGGAKSIPVQVRLVSACNRDLAKEVEAKRFREDLFYRLNVITISLPPLRERKEDIPLLVEHFLAKIAQRRQLAPKRVSEETLELLMKYHWPGNIRQLENELERLVALAPEEILPEYLSEDILASVSG